MIAAEGGQIVAIMPDRQKFVADFKSQSNVPFPILTDMDNGYALSLNLTIWVGAEMQKMMEGRQDLPTFQGNSSWMLPIPATFVVGRDGTIKARFMDPGLSQADGDRGRARGAAELSFSPNSRNATSRLRAAS